MIDKVIKSEGPATPDKWLPRSFHAPEGKRNAEIDDLRRFSQGDQMLIRSIWKMEFEPGDRFTYMAGKSYYETKRRSADEALLDDLFHVLGDGIREFQRPDGSVDLNRLIGLEAHLHIVHQESDRYEDPFCRIVSVRPKKMTLAGSCQDAAKNMASGPDEDLLWELKSCGVN
jgi:hypothetical protein